MRSFFAGLFIASISPLPAPADVRDGFAFIRDPDGFANVRDAPHIGGRVVGKAVHGSLVYCTGDEKDGWKAVSFREGDEEKYGFVHGSRTLPVASLKGIPAKSVEDRRIIFSSGSTKVEIEMGDFDSKKATITPPRAPGSRDLIEKINGKSFWGTDGGLPRTEYSKISVTRGERRTELPPDALANLFQPNLTPDLTNVFYDEKADTLIISALNSDGAGGYVVAFRIVGGIYRDRTVLSPF